MAKKPSYEELEQRIKELEQALSERKHAEDELQRREATIQSVFDATPVGICIMKNRLYQRVNRDWCESFGYPEENLIGRTTEFLYESHEEYERIGKELYKNLLKKGIAFVRARLKCSDGEFRDVDLIAKPLNPYDLEAGTVVVVHDITDHKKAAEALRESEEKYRLLADNITDNIWMLDLGTLSFSYVSPSVVGITGYTAKEAKELQLQDVLTPSSLELATRILNEELSEESRNADRSRSRTLELEQYRKDGTTVSTEVSMRFIRDIEGRPSSILGVTRDVTERKQAEKALQESEERFRQLFDLSPLAVALTDAETGKLIDVNESFCNLSNYSKNDLLGRTTTELGFFSREGRDRFTKELQVFGEIHGLEMDYKTKDGSIHQAVAFRKVIQLAGETSILTALLDVTEQRSLQAQLQQASKMEAMGTLAGGIAHDFNNLLMAIQGRTSIMLMNKDSSHPDFGHLKGVEDNIESAADLTKQLLGFARGGKYEVRPTDLNELIKKQNRMFGRTKKEITIRGKYEENLLSVEVDRGQIQQVLLNLYVNAWQAMPGGGNLNLETENVTLDENYVKPFSIEPGRYVKISVTDTGVGMNKATRERIFEPFFTTKKMGRGTGLGLASAYGIIKNHGGFINVYSEKGHGTTFNVYLPASEKEVIEEKKSAGDLLRGSETVLFIDDEDMIIEVAEELLDALGYKVLIARSGKEAIEIYEENKERIDIVALDMIMPDMSGGDTYDRMKEIGPDIKVLLSSGYSIDGRATEILDRGCNGFIQKPFKMKELSQKLREILDEK